MFLEAKFNEGSCYLIVVGCTCVSLRWLIIKVIADAEGANQLTYPIASLMKPFTPQQIKIGTFYQVVYFEVV